MKRFSVCILLSLLGSSVNATDIATLIDKLKATGPDRAGSAPAAAAWRELKNEKPSAIVPLLSALDGASPLAANWIHSAISAIVESAKKSNQSLPIPELDAFLKDTRHSPAGRRLAFELLCSADGGAKSRLLPTFLNDPAPELRFEAIQVAFDKAKAAPKDDAAARDELKKLLSAARNYTQAEEIVKALDERGEKIDVTTHFGFLTRWRLLSAFDNSDMKGFNTAYPPETNLNLSATPPGKAGEPTKWQFVETKEKYGLVDLNKQIAKLKDAVCYAYAEVESDADRDVELRAASATAVKIFLNGREILARESYHQSADADSHIAPAHLKKGKNTILMKICQNNQTEPWAQEWRFQLRITDSLGKKVPVKELTSETAP